MVQRRRRSRRKGPSTKKRFRTDPEARERALVVLHRMRADGLSLTRAARESQTTLQTVRKYVGSALTRSPGGRYVPKASDRLARRIWLLTPRGKVEISVRGSNAASRVARYMAAVDQYLKKGETDGLLEFEDKSIRAGKVSYPFVTDPRLLDRLAQAGEVSFDRLYVLRA